LEEKGYDVAVLSRNPSNSGNYRIYRWNPEADFIEVGAIEWADYIVHLAGVNIGEKRWTFKQKQVIIDSRLKTADLIFRNVVEKRHSLKAFISSSAVGYYGGERTDRSLNETDPPGMDFLSQVCLAWEQTVDQFQNEGIRTVKLRSGVVLTKTDGVLSKMKVPVNLGIGSPLGSGKQCIPWIHIDDLCSIYIKAIEDHQMSGPFNAVAPDQKTNREFMHLLARVMNKPFWFPPIPSIMLRMILGERASIVLGGNPVSIQKLIDQGFEFKYPDLEGALKNLVL
jgi:uncharacterized protein (TIGR01777 family)